MDAKALADALEQACRDHDAAFRKQGYGPAVMDANDRIGAVHKAHAAATGTWWGRGNEALIRHLREVR